MANPSLGSSGASAPNTFPRHLCVAVHQILNMSIEPPSQRVHGLPPGLDAVAAPERRSRRRGAAERRSGHPASFSSTRAPSGDRAAKRVRHQQALRNLGVHPCDADYGAARWILADTDRSPVERRRRCGSPRRRPLATVTDTCRVSRAPRRWKTRVGWGRSRCSPRTTSRAGCLRPPRSAPAFRTPSSRWAGA
jgi:hypothetical protein